VAVTPTGVFHIFSVINGLWTSTPRSAVAAEVLQAPADMQSTVTRGCRLYPVSHGCVRVSNEAINWIWAANIAPIGEEVWVLLNAGFLT